MGESSEGPTEPQPVETKDPIRETALVLGQLKTLGIIEGLAQSYTDWKSAEAKRSDGQLDDSDKTNTYLEAVTALADLHLAQKNSGDLAQFRKDWGEKAAVFEMYLGRARGDIEKAQTDAYEKVAHMSNLKRDGIALLAILKISQYASKDQFPALNQVLGSTKHTAGKIAASVGLNAASAGAVIALMGAGVTFGELHPTIAEWPNDNAIKALAFSYFAQYAATLFNAKMNMDALKDPKVATTPNILTTLAYYYLPKLAPGNKKIRDIGAYLASFFPVVTGEPSTLALLAFPHGSSMAFNKNIASALGQLATGAALKYYQKKQHMSENQPQEGGPIGQSTFQKYEDQSRESLNHFLDIPVIKSFVVAHLPNLLDDPKSDNPVFNGGILYLAGLATRHISKEDDIRNISLPLRAARAEAYKRIKRFRDNPLEAQLSIAQSSLGTPEIPKIEPRAKFELSRKRLTEQFYTHTRVDVDTSYGKLGGEVAILNPEAEGTPILFIPGSSNDPESVESAAVSIALQTGRKVIVLGYPDGPDGLITKEFSEAVVKETKRAQRDFAKDRKHAKPPSFAPYVEFFDKLIDHLQKNGDKELWTFSSGGPIAAKLLSLQQYQESVTDAVFFNPAGAFTFSVGGINLPFVGRELPFLFSFALSTPLSELLKGRNPFLYAWRDDPRDPKTNEDKYNKVEAWKHLGLASHYRIREWETARVKKGGRILVYTQRGDNITQSYRTFNEKAHPENPQMEVIGYPSGNHETVLTNPDTVMSIVLRRQRQYQNKPQLQDAHANQPEPTAQ